MRHFRVADGVTALERAGEHIIFNPGQVNPVFLPRGGEEALALLRTLREMGTLTNRLGDLCPPHLFDFFLAHSLILPIAPPPPAPGRCHCRSGGEPAVARTVYLLLTHACNQACRYCLNGRITYHEAPALIMSAAVARDALRTIAESITANGTLNIVFFGGEPLLNWPLAKEAIRYCEEELKPAHPGQTLTYHLTSNLTLFPNDLVAMARRYAITFLVDIDGPADLHDGIRPLKGGGRHGSSFRKSADHIGRLRDAGLDVALRATVTSHNHHRLLEVSETHKALGGTGSAFVPLNAVDSDEWIMPFELCPDPARYADGLRQVYRERIWPVTALFPFSEYLSRLQPNFRSGVACGAPLGNSQSLPPTAGSFPVSIWSASSALRSVSWPARIIRARRSWRKCKPSPPTRPDRNAQAAIFDSSAGAAAPWGNSPSPAIRRPRPPSGAIRRTSCAPPARPC